MMDVQKTVETYQENSRFSRYKIITYMMIFVLPPWGIYRVWSARSTFNRTERYAQTMVACVYMLALISELMRLM